MSLASKQSKALAARLKHRVLLQEPVHTTDAAGGAAVAWSDVMTVWAEVRSRTAGKEAYFSGKIQAEETHVITVRYDAAITAQMRAVFGSRLFNIRRVNNVDAANVILELLVEEGVAL